MTVAGKAVEELQFALHVYVPSYRASREMAGHVRLKVLHTPCPALNEILKSVANVVFNKDEKELLEAAYKVWQIREKYLGDLLDLALLDPDTTQEEAEKLQDLWRDVINAAYPE